MRSVPRGITWLLAFLTVQISISTMLKIAAACPQWRVGATALAAACPILSTYLLMRVFAHLPSHLAQGLGVGIGFVGSQFAVAAVARSSLTPLQIAGAVLATVGMFLLSMPSRKTEGCDVAGV
jgi:multidrug transporter EmrE-like cation transporter